MKTTARVLLSLCVAALLVFLLMRWGGVAPTDLLAAWRRLPASALALALAIYAAQYALRAQRFRLLVPPARRPAFTTALAVTSAYGMATILLPAKLGEATYVVYMGRAGGLAAAEALASLVVARLLDFATLFLGLGLACLGVAAAGATELAWFAPLGGGALAAALAVLWLGARGDLLVRVGAWASRRMGLERSALGGRLLRGVDRLAEALREAGRGGRYAAATLISLPMWLCVFAFCAVLGRGFGLPESLGFAESAFGAALAILTSLVPVSAFANFGTLETGWVLGFGWLGVSRELALATGTGLHLVQVAFAVGLGLLGHAAMSARARR